MTDADRTPDTPGSPPWSAATRIGDRDGGVSRRLTVRCRIAASVLGVSGLLLLVVTIFRLWSMVSAGLTLVAVVVLAAAGLLAVRARIWSAVARSLLPAGDGVNGTVGASRPLSPGVPGAPVKRRLGAVVVPIHLAGGAQPGGGALIVHARVDSSSLSDRDEISLWKVGPGGLIPRPSGFPPGPQNSAVHGRFVLLRIRDGAVFLATTRLADTW